MFFTAALPNTTPKNENVYWRDFFPSKCLPFMIILTFVYLLLAFGLGKFLLYENMHWNVHRVRYYISCLLPYQSLSWIHLLAKSFIVHVPPHPHTITVQIYRALLKVVLSWGMRWNKKMNYFMKLCRKLLTFFFSLSLNTYTQYCVTF